MTLDQLIELAFSQIKLLNLPAEDEEVLFYTISQTVEEAFVIGVNTPKLKAVDILQKRGVDIRPR